MAYIVTTDILDSMVNPIVVSKTDYLDRADSFLNDFALEMGVAVADLKTNPVPFKVKMMLVYWICWQVCRDNIGKNVVSLTNGTNLDFYEKKAKEYKQDLSDQKAVCTAAVLTDTINEGGDTSKSVTEYSRA